jgi:hypothetical protein
VNHDPAQHWGALDHLWDLLPRTMAISNDIPYRELTEPERLYLAALGRRVDYVARDDQPKAAA